MPASAAEKWRPVVGWEGVYDVSDLGRVRSLPRPRAKGGVLKPHTRKDYGYQVVTLSRPGFISTRAIHTLVADAFVPNPHFYPLVRHLDGQPSNNHASNLGWGTALMNIEDAQRHGTIPTAQHGTVAKYNKGGCRCAPCRTANTEFDRERRRDPKFAARQRETHRRYRARKKETV